MREDVSDTTLIDCGAVFSLTAHIMQLLGLASQTYSCTTRLCFTLLLQL